MMLTRKQKELLDFIERYCAENRGIPPSFDEMKDALDLASKSGIHRLITALEERGFIRRLPNKARAIEVTRSDGEAIFHLRRLVSALIGSDENFDANFDRFVADARLFLRLRDGHPSEKAAGEAATTPAASVARPVRGTRSGQ